MFGSYNDYSATAANVDDRITPIEARRIVLCMFTLSAPIIQRNCAASACCTVFHSPGGIVLSDIQQFVMTNIEYFYLRVPSCRPLVLQGARAGASAPARKRA